MSYDVNIEFIRFTQVTWLKHDDIFIWNTLHGRMLSYIITTTIWWLEWCCKTLCHNEKKNHTKLYHVHGLSYFQVTLSKKRQGVCVWFWNPKIRMLCQLFIFTTQGRRVVMIRRILLRFYQHYCLNLHGDGHYIWYSFLAPKSRRMNNLRNKQDITVTESGKIEKTVHQGKWEEFEVYSPWVDLFEKPCIRNCSNLSKKIVEC